MSPLARRSHKDGCTTASLQYQWCVDQQNPTLQNLINVLDLTFVQVCSPLLWNLLRIPCTKIIIIIIITLITCKLPLRVSQGTVATFYRCGGQNYNRLFPVFFRIHRTKNYYNRFIFDWVIKNCHRFSKTRCIYQTLPPLLHLTNHTELTKVTGIMWNMTSSSKPEEHNVSHCCQRMTEIRPQATGT